MLKRFFACVVCCSLFASCGRKQRTIFQFNQTESVRINRLVLPVVQEVEAQQTSNGTVISWKAIQEPVVYKRGKITFPATLVGYSVFKLSKKRFIPKQPLNKTPLTQALFVDTSTRKKTHAHSYVIRPIFTIQNQTIIGISSNITHSH